MKKQLVIGTPSGIGDISWIWSKLVGLTDEYDIVFDVADGAPRRAHNYLKLLPELKGYRYGKFDFPFIQTWGATNDITTWAAIKQRGFGQEFLQPNFHILNGGLLQDWLPDLPTNFHYEIATKGEDKISAEGMIKDAEVSTVIGIHAASIRGAKAWNTWKRKEWMQLMQSINRDLKGDVMFVLMGAYWDDLTKSLQDKNLKTKDLCGKTTVAEVLEIHKRIDGYIGFSSGLGVLRTVLGLPTFMLWPDWQYLHIYGWAPPEMVEDGSYNGVIYSDVETVYEGFVKRWLDEHVLQNTKGEVVTERKLRVL